ncbi:MAG TPA: T9SS type A sorting domain-containing protein [Flavobacterium sp.]|nr:T9SS type A sorting domain-containing protein [Flavobacterium sp.]
MKKTILFLVFTVCVSGFAQETINAMTYNLFYYPSAPPANRDLILRDILDAYQPDLFMVCELETEAGADMILNTSLANQSATFDRAIFYPDTSSSTTSLQNMVFFNTEKLVLINQQTLTTNYRDISQYTFRLNSLEQDTHPIHLEVFVTHLKSSTGTANQQARLAMVEVFTTALETITNPNTYVLFTGDFNLYTASEPAYQKIISLDNAIAMVDPINAVGSWHDNANFQYAHTQCTRISNTGFGGGQASGASGGMDDRFDFIMMSQNFTTSADFYYVENTYKAYGNNGNCLDNSINSPDCAGDYSLQLRDNLYWMSDHLPVVMQFETSQTFLSSPSYDKKPLFWFNSSNYQSEYIDLGIHTDEINTTINYIFIYNSIGQILHTIAINQNKNIRLDISNYPKGLYFIKSDRKTATLKFIKK